MASIQAPPGDSPAHARPPLLRRPDRGLLGGVCAGMAEHFGVAVLIVRMVMVAMVAVGGVGIAVYALAWTLVPVAPDSGRRAGRWEALRQALLIGLGTVVALGVLHRLASRMSYGDALWPMVLGICGLALVWRPIAAADRTSGRGLVSLGGQLRSAVRVDAPRLVLGVLLVSFASAGLLHLVGVQRNLGEAIGVVAIIATILGLLTVPWFVRLGSSLSFERAARIREQERAELAAHLHDSVLQTLALIQKRAGDPREVAGLARQQERELRSWLLERPDPGEGASVAAALERAAAEVEELHRVPIEVVTVGDGPLNGRLEAMVQAAREAMTNAAKFAGSERVDLYAEVERDRVEVFVRDRGVGFDPGAIPADRRGVRDSIVARMERHHGRAVVHSLPGEGTEIELVMAWGSSG
ncbi:MAG TPA: PspC domain-containing protein [Solirubrobacteraceae bacterium]|jgi:signal transduction histidine kinase/phage shock protein PspC (stress-responsive transcriptional regulator)|nr:PspC domain-containing protein [Solirubrobacteraceae bacterium]